VRVDGSLADDGVHETILPECPKESCLDTLFNV
jgi:hypothetical protein